MLGLILVFTLLLFPTGRLPSARWRPVAALGAVGIAAITVLSALQPTLKLQNEDNTVRNPRDRLYDIDRLINRTVVYAALTALLGAVYAGVVLVLGPSRPSAPGSVTRSTWVRCRSSWSRW